jgi:hypothetical protein
VIKKAHYQCCSFCDLHFLEDVNKMNLDGAFANVELAGNVLIAKSLRHQLRDFKFSSGQ